MGFIELVDWGSQDTISVSEILGTAKFESEGRLTPFSPSLMTVKCALLSGRQRLIIFQTSKRIGQAAFLGHSSQCTVRCHFT